MRALESSHGGQIKVLRRFDAAPTKKYVPGQVLVRFRPHVSKQFMEYGHRKLEARVIRSFPIVDGLQLVRLSADVRIEDAIRRYQDNPDVLYAEPNYIVETSVLPNDPRFGSQWGLHNIGQDGGTPDADIDAPEAWDLTTGSADVVIAVIDTGIDYSHPDLAANMFRNEVDCNSNNLDDDGNGFIDDCHGIDTSNNDSDPFDDVGHGTHVAGTIGAVGSDGQGVAGVNWTVQLMPCKFLNQFGTGDIANAIACLDYVKTMRDRGVNIVATNNSWSGPFFSQALLDAIQIHLDRGILFIAAAGNDFQDNDLVPQFPANYSLPNVLAVAATGRTDDKATFSNFGRRTVHLGAPGQDILSTLPGEGFGFLSGTSMAAPHVTGVAALLSAQNPGRDWRVLKNLLLAGGDPVAGLSQTVAGRRVNANGSLTCSGSVVQERLAPVRQTIAGTAGAPIDLGVLHINCATPNGAVQVSVSPTNETVTLVDDGFGPDQAVGDGIYSAQWIPPGLGSFTLSFPNGDTVSVQVLDSHVMAPTSPNFRALTGTNLDLGDDSVAEVLSPFPVPFGGGSFDRLFVGSNGTISFTEPFLEFGNRPIPVPDLPVITLVAPFWDDLFPIPATPQNVFVDVLGAAPSRELVVEWRGVRSFHCRSDAGATVEFQVIFFEDSTDILFNYADTTFGGNCSWQDSGGSATVGIQVAPDKGTLWGFGQSTSPTNLLNDQTVGNNTGILWELEAGGQPANPVPTLSGLSPSSATRGDPAFVLTVTGSDFIPASRVLFRGVERLTTFVSSTELRAVILASDLTIMSTVRVSVFNPSPGGGVSNELTFTVDNPVPTIAGLDPSSVLAGGLSFRLKVTGDNFTPFSVVRWNGADRLTTFFDETHLQAAILFTDIAFPSVNQVTVSNPLPGGGTSNVVSFPVVSPTTGQAVAATAESGVLTEPLYIGPEDKRPPRVNKVVPPFPGMPLRFLGWNYAREQGEEYLQHFTRLRARSPVPLQGGNVDSLGALSSRGEASLAQQAPPFTFPGIRMRDSLPAGFIPTGVATGDFNQDGLPDWIVSNGGDNNLWLYLGRGDGTSELPTIIPLSGRSPVWLTVSDLRGNGTLDLIVAEADSASVGILLGNGDGSFGAEQRHFLPGTPLYLLTGDFNGDNIQDILAGLIASPEVGPVALLPGTGGGQFGPPVISPFFSLAFFATFWMDAGDLDGDGDLDIALINLGLGREGAFSYLNNGDGQFKQAQRLVAPSGLGDALASVALGDLDEDGCLDAVVLSTFASARVHRGHCDGSFENVLQSRIFGEGDAGVGLSLADVNGDGHLDLISSGVVLGVHPILGQEAGNLLCVLLGDGTGHFSRFSVYRGESSAFALAVADLNLDGHPDVVTANQDNDSASVFLNEGQGRFGSPVGNYIGHSTDGGGGVLNAPLSPLVLANVNADGVKDLVLVERGRFHPDPFPITVLPGDGNGRFPQLIRSPGIEGTLQPSGSFIAADFRNTSRADFLAIGTSSSAGSFIFFAPNTGGGTFGSPTRLQLSERLFRLAGGDFNNDGKLDFVAAGNSTVADQRQHLRVFLGDGSGTFTPGAAVNFGGSEDRWPVTLHTGDFNRDGKLDVLVWVFENVVPFRVNDVFQFFGNGDGTFQAPRLLFSNFNPFSIVDVDGDGFLDIVEAKHPQADYPDSTTPEFRIYLGQADGSFGLTNTYAPYGGTAFLPTFTRPDIGDFNGDGRIDIAAFQFADGFPTRAYVQFLVGNGDGSFTPTFDVFEFHKRFPAQFPIDATGDGAWDLVELNGFPSSFHVIPAAAAPRLQLRLVSDPVIGTVGHARVSLNTVQATDTSVLLSASHPAISLPSSLTIPAGSVTQEFEFMIGSGFDPSLVFFLEAQLGTDVARAFGTQALASPAVGFVVVSNPPLVTLEQGQSSREFTFNVESVGGYSTTVSLSCSGLPAGAACSFLAPTLDVPSGGFNGTRFTISTSSSTPTGKFTVTAQATDGVLTASDTVELTVVESTNTIPIADAGIDRALEADHTSGTAVQLDGTASFDSDGDPLTFRWTGSFPEGGGTVTGVNPTVTLSAGTNTVTLVVNDGKVDSAPDTVQITITDFQLSVDPPEVTVSQGQSANYTITVEPLFGPFGRSVSFSCSGLPVGASCTFSPAGVTPGNSSMNVTLTVSTTASGAAVPFFERGPSPLSLPLGGVLMGLVLVLITLLQFYKLQPKFGTRFCFSLLIVLLIWQIGCGGGGGSGGFTTVSQPETPSGSHVITIKGTSGSLEHTATATLVVQ